MAIKIKDKLLVLLDDLSLSDVDNAALIDLLAGKIKRLQEEVDKADGRVAAAEQKAHDFYEMLQREGKRMRSDPTYWRQGYYGFKGGDDSYIVEIRSGHVQLSQMKGSAMYVLNAVPLNKIYTT